MQTFLPSSSFWQSAKWLDNQRLGKQRVECLQILKALTDPDYGWQSHPAVKMWRGYEYYLTVYGLTVCDEWIARGYKDSCGKKIYELYKSSQPNYPNVEKIHPPWLTEDFASNHRSILLGKAYEKANELAMSLTITSIAKKNKDFRKWQKSDNILIWYQSHGWTEQPAQRVNNKWPYSWPEMEK